MNGFVEYGMDEANFEEKKGLGEGLRTFDAFPKTKNTYTTRNASGGQWTLFLLIICILLSLSELRRFYHGSETHQFSVEKGVGHDLQINMDLVVAMHCDDLHVNVQDASGDRIRAGDVMRKDMTSWDQWADTKGVHKLASAIGGDPEEEHVADVMGKTRGRKKFKKTPRLRGQGDSCRVFGSMEVNKVQADFHITARGHGYENFGDHLNHDLFNFSHVVNELSFGPLYLSLHNPLDATLATTDFHFYKFQYYLSIVPTLYSASSTSKSVTTNQYAVTEQSHVIGEQSVPGVFFKFDIEPILLMVREERGGFLAFSVRLVNVISGVLVAGGWCYQLWEMLGGESGILWKRRGRRKDEGMLSGRDPGEMLA
ncbi:MAG: hypothetical protein M1837_005426 [Sclerophora amabilis]|nr:MAG: hypothetical protein M1837_005426 [Sclerophora amabilis]